MFNFLKQNKQTETTEETLHQASISYKIDETDTISVDIQVQDYDAESIDKLCKILDVLANDKCYMQTLEILKEGFIKENAMESLEQVYVHLSTQVSNKILNSIAESQKDQPCIKPSQILK